MPDNRIQTTEVKKVKSRSKLLFIITIIAYLTALLIYSYWNYIYFNNELMETIDRELLISAVSLKYILPDDFHDRAIDEQSISIEEDKYNALKLSKLLKETGFKYIYTVIKKENKLFFITSDLTADPKSERGTWYYYPYEEADKSFYDAFTQNKPTYKNVSDQWGTVRTVMVPETSPGGIVYLACADYDISFVNETLQRNLLRSIAGILFFVLLAIPFFLIYRSIRRKHLNSLRESEEQQRTLINTVPDIIVKVNTEGIITFITENTFNLFPGMGTEDILGKNMFSFLARDDHQRAAENTLLMFERQLGPVEYRIGPSEDTLKDVEVNGDVMRDLNGNPTGMVYTIRDITDRKKSEEKLQKSEEKYRIIFGDHGGRLF
ncbi:PAS domain S-box protein [bacterium]|nr:PAS domain S-box protein [bacterium]